MVIRLATKIEKSLDATCLWGPKSNPIEDRLSNPIQDTREQNYLELLSQAIKERNIEVRRILLVDKDDLSSQEFQEHFKKDKGSSVRAIALKFRNTDGAIISQQYKYLYLAMSALPSKGFKIAAIALREQWSLKGTQPVPIDFGIWDQKTAWHLTA